MVLEASIEARVVQMAERDGWYVRKLKWIGRRSAPDRMFVRDGRVVFIEFKRPGGRRSAGQIAEVSTLRKHGAEAYFVDSVDTAMRILNADRP